MDLDILISIIIKIYKFFNIINKRLKLGQNIINVIINKIKKTIDIRKERNS